MANINDYLEWRGDIPFSFDGLNEVDALIMSQLSYLQLEDILVEDSPEEVSLKEVGKRYFKKYSRKKIEAGTALFQNTSNLLRLCMNTRRYGNISLRNYRSDYDPARAKQFGALTIRFLKEEYYVSFRGTDDTLAGWQEDFQVCYTMPVASQIEAEAYLTEVLKQIDGKAVVGGHSKGGNLAMYSSMRVDTRLKNRIVEVYNFDGPGFMEEVVHDEEYLSIKDRVHSYMPEESIVGMILYHDGAFSIVDCTDRGITQHNAETWQVRGRCFETVKEFKNSSLIFNEAVHKWIKDISDEEREFFVELVFSTLETGGESFSEMMSHPREALGKIYQTYHGMDKETKKMARNIIGQVIKLGTLTVTENIKSNVKLPELVMGLPGVKED